mgnify:CR=1 FL=1
MRIPLTLFLIIVWTFLILAPLNAFAEDKIFTCKPVVGGYPKNGDFYVEDIHDESTPLIDIMPTSLFLIREDGNVYYKNNPSREFEVLVPYERLKDSKEMQEIESSLSSWDEMISLKNIRTYYLRYKGDDGYESLKRISINESNTKTADITIPDADFPSYFFLRECESENTKEPIQVDFQEGPDRKLS